MIVITIVPAQPPHKLTRVAHGACVCRTRVLQRSRMRAGDLAS